MDLCPIFQSVPFVLVAFRRFAQKIRHSMNLHPAAFFEHKRALPYSGIQILGAIQKPPLFTQTPQAVQPHAYSEAEDGRKSGKDAASNAVI